MLLNRLLSEGYKVIKSEFHRYDTKTGDLIYQWLTGKWKASQEVIELIMTSDKQNQMEWFNELECQGYDYLILDRYTLSQFSYGKANGMNINWLLNLQKYMRKPDLDIVIDIPAEVSMSRKGKHNNGENDRYEADLEMLQRVRDNYLLLPEKYSAPLKYIVDGTKTIEEIHNDIYQIVIDNLT
ncbi:dTMP kinase [Paenibacillus sp. GCM10027627]|uniref:dTMP kinase n=1 Tax=unclassified Paenibacillus TaxID=185978 RepID=UPI003627B16E